MAKEKYNAGEMAEARPHAAVSNEKKHVQSLKDSIENGRKKSAAALENASSYMSTKGKLEKYSPKK